jgi:arginase
VASVAVLGVPMDLGAGRRGVDMGPSALRLAGLGDTLRALGHEVADHGNLEVPVAESLDAGHRPRYLEAIAVTCCRAAEIIATLAEDDVPVVLGGDHSLSLGSVAGVGGGGGRGWGGGGGWGGREETRKG